MGPCAPLKKTENYEDLIPFKSVIKKIENTGQKDFTLFYLQQEI